jgi:glycine betaine/proline transport system substrate-binding protein
MTRRVAVNVFKQLLLYGAFSAALIAAFPRAADTKPLIKIGYVEGWDDSAATTNVAARIIEKRLGYPVKLVPVATGMMWEGVARGDLDATLSAWLPVTQGAYWEKYKTKVVNLGENFSNARIGLIVPADAKTNSIADLESQKSKYDGRIVGIDAGSGIMSKTEQALRAYNLDYRLMPSSGAAMTAELARSMHSNKLVIVTGWAPHWMFAKWKLKFLDDPKNVYGKAEHVDSVVNRGLEAKAKPVVTFLKQFRWQPGEIDSVMLAAQNGTKPDAAADAWIAAHPSRVNSWLAGTQ